MDARFRFWSAVRAEARLTWWGRFRWLWIASAGALVAWMAVTTEYYIGEAPFDALCAATCWSTAWLSADLLSLRFPRNPEPLREWAPVAFLARAVGRLLPSFAALLAAVGTFTARGIYRAYTDPDSTPRLSAEQALHWWVAWTFVFLASALPYIAVATLLSAMARRPRRWLTAPITVVGGTLLLAGGLALAADHAGLSDVAVLPNRVSVRPIPTGIVTLPLLLIVLPNYWLGIQCGVLLTRTLHPEFPLGPDWFPALCWSASAGMILLSLPFLAWTWRIAAIRWRRHPLTVDLPLTELTDGVRV